MKISRLSTRLACARPLAALGLLVALVLAGCTQSTTTSPSPGAGASEPAASSQTQPAPPRFTKWVVYINDDDSYSAGGITYKIALNLTATNASSDPAGKYAGDATASTSTEGNVGGAQLSAQALAQSGQLSFTLQDPSGGGALASLDPNELPDLSGRGTITMSAAGSGTIGGAGGSFSNTSSQKIDVTTNGSKATLKVAINGHTYTFNGTISGKE